MPARRWISDRRGNVAMIACLCAPFLFMLVGLSVDFSVKSQAKALLQNSLDSALLAAVHVQTDAERNAVAQHYASQNFAEKYGAHSLSITLSDAGNDTLSGAASITVPNYFGGLFGKPESEIQAIGAVRTDTPPLDVMLVLDKTGSMWGPKLDALKSSANDLIDQVMDGQKVRMGVVPFANYVNIGMGLRSETGFAIPADHVTCVNDPMQGEVCTNHVWNGCVGSRAAPFNEQDANTALPVPGVLDVTCGANPMTRLTVEKSTVADAIDALTAAGNTYIPAGLMIGWHALSHRQILPDGKDPATAEGKNLVRAIVLMTDGQNTISKSPAGADHESNDTEDANAVTASLCANVKADGVKVYTVAFQVNDPTILDILQQCASTPSDAFDAANASQLTAAFRAIGDSLTRVRLSK